MIERKKKDHRRVRFGQGYSRVPGSRKLSSRHDDDDRPNLLGSDARVIIFSYPADGHVSALSCHIGTLRGFVLCAPLLSAATARSSIRSRSHQSALVVHLDTIHRARCESADAFRSRLFRRSGRKKKKTPRNIVWRRGPELLRPLYFAGRTIPSRTRSRALPDANCPGTLLRTGGRLRR